MVNNPSTTYESTQYSQPSAGNTVNISPTVYIIVLEPAGLLATLTVNLPATPSRGDGHEITITSTQIVTALTLGAGAGNTIAAGALTALGVGGFAKYVYRATKWYRVG